MSLAFDDLPVALPPGLQGARVAVSSALPLVASTPVDAASSARRRAEFLAGRLAAAEATRRLGLPDPGVLGRTSTGAPAWPTGVVGAISHHSGVACAVVGTAVVGVGVDIAPLLSEAQLRAVGRRCLIDPERERWSSSREISVVFAAKEAIYKAAHPQVGRYIGFDEAEITEQTGGAWTARLGQSLSAELGVGWVSGAFAWEDDLVYSVLVLRRVHEDAPHDVNVRGSIGAKSRP